jgi:hypothetical protein
MAGCTLLALSPKEKAKCHARIDTIGLHSIMASYSGDSSYAASNSPDLSIVVDPASTTTILRSSANPASPGKAVTYRARISPIPDGGTVAFTDAGETIPRCSSVTVSTSTGKATCTVTYSWFGTHTIVANYSGDNNYTSSISQTLRERVT